MFPYLTWLECWALTLDCKWLISLYHPAQLVPKQNTLVTFSFTVNNVHSSLLGMMINFFQPTIQWINQAHLGILCTNWSLWKGNGLCRQRKRNWSYKFTITAFQAGPIVTQPLATPPLLPMQLALSLSLELQVLAALTWV